MLAAGQLQQEGRNDLWISHRRSHPPVAILLLVAPKALDLSQRKEKNRHIPARTEHAEWYII